jgi:predicted aspartyl protease
MPSLTVQVPNLHQFGPVVQVQLAPGKAVEDVVVRAGGTPPAPVAAVAMIDTGATGTVINPAIVQQLGLQPVGSCTINTPSQANVPCFEYLIRLVMPNSVTVETVAIGAPLHGQHIQCLIGRDVLQHAVFIYTGYNNTFTLAF